MKNNHTQGNWHAHDGQIYPEETGVTVALIPYFDKDNAEHQANSKLISAAPDMLEALQQFLHSVEHEGVVSGRVVDAVRNAKEAIYKAL
jgi:hypothetical protein